MISSSFLSDIFVNILANLVSSIVLLAVGFIAGRWWDYSRKGRAFRRMFGTRAGKKEDLFIVLDTLRDTRMLSGTEQQKLGLTSQGSTTQRFYKIFPDGHLTAISGPREAVVPDCSARASAYLIDALRGIRGISTKTVSDQSVASKWNGTFITLGSSYSNIKTDDIKHLPENSWLLDDSGSFRLKDGNVIDIDHIDQRYDKGLILKLWNPHAEGHSVIICAGLGEWGTSGSACFLAMNWGKLSRRFGKNQFLVLLNVTMGNDESGREILARGQEVWFWRLKQSIKSKIKR